MAANNQRSTRIILASVFTSTRHSSTDNFLSDSTVSGISSIAFFTGYDVYFDCPELWRKDWIIKTKSTPATDYSKGTSRWLWGGQRNWLNCWSVGEWNRYLKWNTVIIERFYWKDGVLPRMICTVINKWTISTQPLTGSVLQSFVTLLVCAFNTYSTTMCYQLFNLRYIISDDLD